MLTNNKTYKNDNLRDVQKVFNDGVCRIYRANERVIGERIGKFFVCKESVGERNYYHAYNNNIRLDTAISIPYNEVIITTQDVCLYQGIWYQISRIQYKDNKKPFHWTLSLTRSPFSYEVQDDD